MNKDQEMMKILETTSPWYSESHMTFLSEEDRKFLLSFGRKMIFQKNQVIQNAYEYVNDLYYVDQGLIKCVVTNSNGNEKTVYYTDRFLALECFFHEQPCAYSTIAASPTTIYKISRDTVYNKGVLGRTGIRDMMLLALSNKCRILGWQVKNLSQATPLEKVCHLLCCYFLAGENQKTIHLTHQELASLTGMHRVTVTKTLNGIRKMGIIDVDKKGQIILLDWENLRVLGTDGSLEGF